MRRHANSVPVRHPGAVALRAQKARRARRAERHDVRGAAARRVRSGRQDAGYEEYAKRARFRTGPGARGHRADDVRDASRRPAPRADAAASNGDGSGGTGGRASRHRKKYEIIPTPLTRLTWWRVVLDEAQEVESSTAAAAAMACLVPGVHRWAVTGTPVSRGVEDLQGLFAFLRAPSPLTDRRWFRRVVEAPFEKDTRRRFRGPFSTCCAASCVAQHSRGRRGRAPASAAGPDLNLAAPLRHRGALVPQAEGGVRTRGARSAAPRDGPGARAPRRRRTASGIASGIAKGTDVASTPSRRGRRSRPARAVGLEGVQTTTATAELGTRSRSTI